MAEHARLSRRHLLGGGVAALGAAGLTYGMAREPDEVAFGGDVVPFHGKHQAGIATSPQAHGMFVAFDLLDGRGRDDLIAILRMWTADAGRLTQGLPALADTEPELATEPSRLTVTVGLGPGAFEAAGVESPVGPLPAFGIDRLESRWSDGDLLLQICADDPVPVAHAVRVLTKNVRSMASTRWVQRGFRPARGSQVSGTTMRNLMGQIDGTENLAPTTDFDTLVWDDSGGTTLVLRRIAVEMDAWDELDRGGREFAVGRRLDTGAPLTGESEHDTADFEATDKFGIPVISPASHIARARHRRDGERFFRRAYNYDDPPSSSGLIFAAYQRDIEQQFLPVQRRLDEHDALNEWTTPIGSAVFTVPPGVAEGGYLGEGML
ncbi:Dyp-type peroxidase [Rhodococcoides kyotonense]|uniref:Dye decolorizing peroxidase n=1 Tax=Rhodococcoides kyotonense TaxID=398843 RepID=A0A239GS66_9NOCA|nr:Dyp-type peroxidase [Rhodococcus kyotonensis]SNS71980.1 dye decolorizing peroxidase [Rhodococcus kyotonensis]